MSIALAGLSAHSEPRITCHPWAVGFFRFMPGTTGPKDNSWASCKPPCDHVEVGHELAPGASVRSAPPGSGCACRPPARRLGRRGRALPPTPRHAHRPRRPILEGTAKAVRRARNACVPHQLRERVVAQRLPPGAREHDWSSMEFASLLKDLDRAVRQRHDMRLAGFHAAPSDGSMPGWSIAAIEVDLLPKCAPRLARATAVKIELEDELRGGHRSTLAQIAHEPRHVLPREGRVVPNLPMIGAEFARSRQCMD